MHHFIQLRVCTGTESWLITAGQTAKVDELFNTITQVFVKGINPSQMRLLCGDIHLEYGIKKCFKDYHLVHLSTIVALLPVCGGVFPLKAIKVRKTTLDPLPGFITVTSLPSEPDMITLDDSPDEKRAKMPCGHVIGPGSMTSYCQSVLSEGKFKFCCPSVGCNREWEYFLVRHVACLSEDDMKAFEKKISDNYLEKAKGFQTCPGCETWCYRKDATGNFVRCPLCNKDFCWACMRDWNAPGNRQLCGNPDCDGRDSTTRNLASCPTKEIRGCQACPRMRACPKCGMLTDHKDACAHVTCPSCNHGFCFICLKGKTSSDAWPCSPSGTCPLAPRQTSTSLAGPAGTLAPRQTSTSLADPADQSSGWRCSVM